MAVEVVHCGKDFEPKNFATSVFESDSWSVDPETNTLTIGNYEASFARGYWYSVKKVSEE